MVLSPAAITRTLLLEEEEEEEGTLVGGPPQKKRRTFSPTSLTEFQVEVSLGRVGGKELLAISPMEEEDSHEDVLAGMDCSVVCLTTEMIFAEYLNNSDENMIRLGLGMLWGRLGGGEFASSVTMAIRKLREEILNSGGHWVLSKLMEQYQDDLSIQVRCCSILRELLLEGGAARYQVYCAGGMDRTIEAMNKFPENVHMQLPGCQFLSRLILAPVSTTILEDMVRSTMSLRSILRLLSRLDDESDGDDVDMWEGTSSMKKELHSAATSLVWAMVGQCPFGLRAEILKEIEQHLLDQEVTRCLTMMLEDYGSCSVCDEQYLL
jgi:hypothetical protein